MIDEPLRAAAQALLARAGLPTAFACAQLSGGGNNRVYRLDLGGQRVVLKAYFAGPDDRRPRLAREFAFARFAWSRGIRCLPEPIAADFEANLALYGHVDGVPLRGDEVTEDRVREALAFLTALDAGRETEPARGLPAGAEACFSLDEHLATVARRVKRLASIEPNSDIDARAATFVADELSPAWVALRDGVERRARSLGLDPAAVLAEAERRLSPSDFGFHNALLGRDGTLCFLDFEYAGWDDPAKLVGDFFNQVAMPVPLAHYGMFADALAETTDDPPFHRRRFDLLLPVYRVKWVCIVLDVFVPAGRRRRDFARGADRNHGWEQLDLARKMLRRCAAPFPAE